MKNNPVIDLAALYDDVSDMITERLVIEGAIKLDHNLLQLNDNIVDIQLTVSKNIQTVEESDQDPDAEPEPAGMRESGGTRGTGLTGRKEQDGGRRPDFTT